MTKDQWNKIIIEDNGCFLQSWQWGQFQQSLGRKVFRISADEKILGQIIKHNLPFNKSFLYCPRGPLFQGQIDKNFFNKIKEIAQKENAIFLKVEPNLDIKSLKKSNSIQPQTTLIIDLENSEEALLNQMSSKTRYNIRLAQKKNVKIEIIAKPDQKDIEIFWQLANQTAGRDNFKLYPKKYYQKMIAVLSEERMLKLFTAKYEDKVIVSNTMIFFGNTAYYLHGSSDYNARNLMAPHLCQWQAILKAKMMGLKYYDFWGVDEIKWPGVTRFKKGFGGREASYQGAYDLIFQPIWYKLYNLAKNVV